MPHRPLWILLLLLAASCDGESRAPLRFATDRAASRGFEADGEGGEGGARPGDDAEAVHDVSEGPCPLGAQRRCKAVSETGCLEGMQYCVDSEWSACLRYVEPDRDGTGEGHEAEDDGEPG